jgi:hypothetical protein
MNKSMINFFFIAILLVTYVSSTFLGKVKVNSKPACQDRNKSPCSVEGDATIPQCCTSGEVSRSGTYHSKTLYCVNNTCKSSRN